MKNAVLGLCLLGACAAMPLSAQAVTVQVDQYKCSAVLSDPEILMTMALWTDGYLSSVTGDLVSDAEYFQEMYSLINEYCSANPDAPFWDVIKENYNVE